MFTAYFDESGTSKDSTALTVAGAVSSNQKWRRLEKQWNEILANRVVKIFHMKDCAAGRGEFSGWSSSDRRNFIYDLSECMGRHVKYAWSCNIVLDCWTLMNEEFTLREHLGTPYCLGAAMCIYAVEQWKTRSKISSAIEYIFESGAEGRGGMVEWVQKNQGITPILKPKALAGLQVADLIAWKSRRLLHDMVSDPLSMTAADYNASVAPIRRVGSNYFVMETEKLTRMCTRMGIPPRPRKAD